MIRGEAMVVFHDGDGSEAVAVFKKVASRCSGLMDL